MAAEDVLHDLGVIPITSSDAHGMGRAGETVRRTFAVAAKMKVERGAEHDRHDNDRVLRYLAKLTINPAIAHGLSHEIGALRPGLLADIVLWRPASFGAKPQLVLKGGFPAWGPLGDGNAAVECAEPVVLGPQFGGHGGAPAELSVAFVSSACRDSGEDALPTRRRRVAVRNTRGIGLPDMVRNTRLGIVQVAPREAAVTLDGELLESAPAESVPLSRLYFL
jgi:urease subunit alpha